MRKVYGRGPRRAHRGAGVPRARAGDAVRDRVAGRGRAVAGRATMALGIKINFANFIAFPITFGIGVDYAINIMTPLRARRSADVARAVRSTGGAVALCSLTTIIGYSSLLLAQNRALFLFGVLAVLGEVACLTTALIALPAVLILVRPSAGPQLPSMEWDEATRAAGAAGAAETSSAITTTSAKTNATTTTLT